MPGWFVFITKCCVFDANTYSQLIYSHRMSQEKGTTPIDSGTEGFYGGIFHQVKQLQFYVNYVSCHFSSNHYPESIIFRDPEGGGGFFFPPRNEQKF